MRGAHMKLPFLFVIAMALLSVAHAQQIRSVNYTQSQANATINSAYGYVNKINESGYLLFQPNLSSAYGYLSKATELENVSPNSAIFYADKAVSSAQQQYGNISFYKAASFPVVVIISLVFFALLIKVMIPVKREHRGK